MSDLIASAEAEVQKIEDKVEFVTAEEFEKLVAEEEKIVAEATKIEHVVVQEVKQTVANVEVAAENVIRKTVHISLPAGGGSVIKNPG
jgi:hypothetical protein